MRLLHALVYPGRGARRWWGPVVRRPPQTGPKQPAGGIEEAPCCTDWPDSSDSSWEDTLSAGRWEEGYLSSLSGTPSTPPPRISPQNLSLSHFQSHSTIFILLFFFCLASLPGPKRRLRSYALHAELEQLPGFSWPSSPDRHYNWMQLLLLTCSLQ